ncbi:MAG TPA: hypothetical protein VLI71_02425 [Gammaproteobacteria bacterium]|nr:hypothetical protein [Gammaproteobacteria bacterium]
MLSPQRGGSKLIAMRRATFVLVSALTAAVVAGALLYSHDSLPSSVASHSGRIEAVQPQQPPSAGNEQTGPDSDSNEEAVAQEPSPGASVNDRIRRQRRPEPDEATLRADMRKQAAQDVRDSYSLLLEDLDVPAEQKKDLEALLIDMLVEGMWTATSTFEIRGREIPQQERYERIADVIGDQNLLRFLELEQNSRAYWETQMIASLLRRNDLPLTKTQRDGVFDILVEVNARYPHSSPPADVDDESVEWIEHVLMTHEEHDRHVMELAPTVLSQDQVVRLFAKYQSMSRERVDSVERAKKLKAEQPGRFRGWSYSPGSWN